jgi:tetrahydromethanopterin S-methyltransferase subunit C
MDASAKQQFIDERFLAATEKRDFERENRTLMLAVIAGFIAWLITHLLRLAFG